MPIIHLEDGIPPSKTKLKLVDGSQSGNVLSGNSIITELTPPDGFIWEVVDMYLNVKNKTGSASGTQSFDVYNWPVPKLFGACTFGNPLTFDYSHWSAADSSKLPADVNNALSALQSIVVSDTIPLRITYANDLDVTQTWGRSIFILVKESPKI